VQALHVGKLTEEVLCRRDSNLLTADCTWGSSCWRNW